MICIKNISFSYENTPIFQNVNLNFEGGKIYTILGKSGSGKSTLLKIILGLEKISKGEIKILNKPLYENLYEIRKNIGYVHQNPEHQFISENIYKELAFTLENYCYNKEAILSRISELLDFIDMKEKSNIDISNLSGGEKQKISIASALSTNPKILIFDEITSMLNPEYRNFILNRLKLLKNNNHCIIFVTHHLEELEFSDKVIYINNHSIEFFGDKSIFIKKIINSQLFYSNNLPPTFEILKNIYTRTSKDYSDYVFNPKKVGDLLRNSL